MSGRWPGWSNLPPELLHKIAEDHLTSSVDIISFRLVCTSWRSAASAALIRPQLPWLLLPYHHQSPSLSFYSPSDQTLQTLTLPNATWKSIFASSSNGYLLLLEKSTTGNPNDGLSVSLFNPITKNLIPFPSLPPELKSPFIRKAVVSLTPAPLAAVWIDKKLAFCLLTKPYWRVIDVAFCYGETLGDLGYHNGYFFLASWYNLQVFNVKLSQKMSRAHWLFLALRPDPSLHFVVSSSGNLLLLVGSIGDPDVYKVERSSKGVWSAVPWALGGDELFFVSSRNSVCVPMAEGVSGWEERRGCYAEVRTVDNAVTSHIQLAVGGPPDQYYWSAPREHLGNWKDVTGVTWFVPKLG